VADTIESVRTYSALSLDQLMRVARITQQMLKFHRQTGMAKRTRLSEVMGGVLDLFQARTIPAEIAVEVRVEREASIVCMPGEAQQIFANLVTNAIEAMPRGGRLVIRFRPSRDWRDRKTEGMRVTVCDSGTGMDRATMRRIFEPFFTTKTDTGTGLGMWVVAQLVERHLGHVRVWSRQSGQVTGTVFSVFFPLGSEMENNSAANDGELQADEKDISAAYAHSGAR
jgi:two-component system CheB/CheR fusion protein